MKKSAVFLSFIVLGFVDFVGATVGYARHDLNLPVSTVQWIPFVTFIWFAVFALPAGVWQSRFGKKTILIIGIILTGLGYLLNFSLYSFATLLCGFVMIGVGNTLIQVSGGPLLQDLSSPEKFSSQISFGQFLKSFMAAIGPVIALYAAAVWGDWKIIFILFAVFSFGLAIWLAFGKMLEKRRDPSTIPGLKDVIKLFKIRYLLLMFLGIVSVVGIDVSMNTGIAVYFEDVYGLSPESSSLAISVYFLALMTGRLIGGVLLMYVHPGKFLFGSAFVAIFLFVLLFLIDDVDFGYAIVVLFGLSSANFFPLIYSIAINKFSKHANEISGMMTMGISGAALAPLALGSLNDLFGTKASYVMIIFLLLFIILISIYNLGTKVPANLMDE